ncbi:MAG: hypothetical protein JXC33_00275 [Deltaproteobacteria bacterium]|nr:hypothetical protein [Deltaproteobacteria bacterium]
MTAGEIIENIEGLSRDRLTYSVRAGCVNPKKIKRRSLYFNEFSERDLSLIGRAWEYIYKHDMRTGAAFKRAERELAASPR